MIERLRMDSGFEAGVRSEVEGEREAASSPREQMVLTDDVIVRVGRFTEHCP